MPVAFLPGTQLEASDELADLYWETDPAIFSFIFANGLPDWRRVFPAEWRADFGNHPASETTLACLNGRPVGLLTSFPGASVESRFNATLDRELAALEPRARDRMLAAFAAMEWLFPKLPQGSLYVLNLAVAPDMRGQGLARRLLEAAVAKARNLGLAEIHLDTAADRPAVAFYERLGFRAVVESRACNLRDGITLPTHLRMVLSTGEGLTESLRDV